MTGNGSTPTLMPYRDRDAATQREKAMGTFGSPATISAVTRPQPEDDRSASTLAAVERFNAAFALHDVGAVMNAMTDDCVFENTFPAPDGARHVGQAAVRATWEAFFRASPGAVFETEDVFAADDRCVVRWLYRWTGDSGETGYVRGVDVFRVRDGKVAEKLSYVKG